MNAELRAAGPGLVDNGGVLQSILAGCGDCIKILDLDGRLQFMSEGGKRVMEVDDFSALKGCPWPDFWNGEGHGQAVVAVETAKAGKTARFSGPANTAKGSPRFWDVQVSPIFSLDGRTSHLLSISRDITEEHEAKKQQERIVERERFLSEELLHRTKNTLALVLSVANQTFRGEAYAAALQTFSDRVMTLARANDNVNSANGTKTTLSDIVDAGLMAHRTGEGRFRVSGPKVNVSSRQAVTLTLAINELATNAAKYGAMSSPTGRVEITWTTALNGTPSFRFLWREKGGPIVVKPSRVGFGSRLISDFVAKDFGGDVRLSYEPDGVVCEINCPIEHLET